MSDVIVETTRFDGNRVVKTRVKAGRQPLVTDDETKCYDTGCVWLVVPANDVYVLIAATSGSAVWRKTFSNAGGGGGAGGGDP